MTQLAWLIPIFPLVGFLINALWGKKLSKSASGIAGSAAVLASFVIALGIFLGSHSESFQPVTVKLFDWISAGTLNIPFEFLIDQFALMMLLIVTGIGFLIHVYSIGYMHDDEGFQRFFSYLNLFIFFMLLLVMGNNYLIVFIGWEGVGLCSYLLIGFWYKNQAYNDAAKKAFIMNRIGDLGFLLGLFLMAKTFGTLTFSEVFEASKAYSTDSSMMIAITVLLFIGAIGKSAQLPLYTWLPDAMAGPTPVSALIHAATMVTAGIYLIARSNPLFSAAPFTQNIILVVGLLTAIFAATIGLKQNDIKKVLAYSTVSQLGFMFIALGLGAYTTAFFHVTTHAFFKALLFLGAGSVIHAMGGEQDIRFMGGLKDKIPTTYKTFLIGTIAIAGIPPLAGFFSKDEILAFAFGRSPFIWALGAIASMVTAFYMFRLLFLTFFGEFRGSRHQLEHLHESPASMTVPLMVLAGLSIMGGFMGVPEVLGGSHWLKEYLSPVFGISLSAEAAHLSHTTEYMLMAVAVALAAAMILYAKSLYVTKGVLPEQNEINIKGYAKVLYHKYYIDELYDKFVVQPMSALSGFLYRFVEVKFVDGIVNGLGQLAMGIAQNLRLLQTGATGFYIFIMVISIIAALFLQVF
ncbi:MAG: NADH-quinone oxidoreductase subunit L [Bacteroidia bacterium]|nr:NADH-quinone oxidoreductase subunit L [Bacteroidia bacterium]